MSCTKIMASVAIVGLLSTSAHAQVRTVNELPVTYSDEGAIKPQHIKYGDVSPEEHQRLLDEAAKIRAFRNNSDSYSSGPYVNTYSDNYSGIIVDSEAPVNEFAGSYKTITDENGYEIQLFEGPATPYVAPTTSYASTTTYEPTVASVPVTQFHTVAKNDTLFSLSKRFGVSIQDIQSANGLSGNNIRLGQSLSIPQNASTVSAESFYVEPATTYASTYGTTSSSEPIVYGSTSYDSTSFATTDSNLTRVFQPVQSEYGVLPKDTLYSIARTACTSHTAIAALNGISDPTTIQPGQILKMPEGHCLKN